MLSYIFLSLILPKCVKTREPEDEHCVLWYTLVYVTPFTPSTTIHNMGAHLGFQN